MLAIVLVLLVRRRRKSRVHLGTGQTHVDKESSWEDHGVHTLPPGPRAHAPPSGAVIYQEAPPASAGTESPYDNAAMDMHAHASRGMYAVADRTSRVGSLAAPLPLQLPPRASVGHDHPQANGLDAIYSEIPASCVEPPTMQRVLTLTADADADAHMHGHMHGHCVDIDVDADGGSGACTQPQDAAAAAAADQRQIYERPHPVINVRARGADGSDTARVSSGHYAMPDSHTTHETPYGVARRADSPEQHLGRAVVRSTDTVVDRQVLCSSVYQDPVLFKGGSSEQLYDNSEYNFMPPNYTVNNTSAF